MFEQLLIKADIDAGTGHLLLQLGLALLAGSLFYIRSITEWFRGDKKESVTETYSSPPPAATPRTETVVEIATKRPKATKGKTRKTAASTKARSKKPAKTTTRRRAS
jgi:hypothetical protein